MLLVSLIGLGSLLGLLRRVPGERQEHVVQRGGVDLELAHRDVLGVERAHDVRLHPHVRLHPSAKRAHARVALQRVPVERVHARVPGVADVMADGVARVYDKDDKVQTFLFVRGNDKDPKKDEPLKLPWMGVSQMTGLNKDVAEIYGRLVGEGRSAESSPPP